MTDDNLDKLFNDPRVSGLEDEINTLKEQLMGVQRVLVENKAVHIADSIVTDGLFKELEKRKQSTITRRLYASISTLRGKLAEEAIPEDAYDEFCADVRVKLQSIFTPEQIDSLLSSSAAWKKLIGFPY